MTIIPDARALVYCAIDRVEDAHASVDAHTYPHAARLTIPLAPPGHATPTHMGVTMAFRSGAFGQAMAAVLRDVVRARWTHEEEGEGQMHIYTMRSVLDWETLGGGYIVYASIKDGITTTHTDPWDAMAELGLVPWQDPEDLT